MTTLNLSSNGPSISKSYQTVVSSSLPATSPTHSQWAVFSVSTPLFNAFQPDAGNKESVLKVQNSGEGELADLIDEFSEGKVQFAFAKVTDPNTGLPKNVLIAWCGEGVPERTKGYFTSHLSAVSKFLHGYHVQITARSDADLTVEGIMKKVSDASGAKYTSESDQSISGAPNPPVSTKPVFTPSRSGGIAPNKTTTTVPLRVLPDRISPDDGWGPDAPPVTRTQLEKVQPAYKPTKVNINELKSGKEPTGGNISHVRDDSSNVVKGGYQPVGKVDIAAIRRQARESGNLQDDRPEPVKGAYEPVGKVDIAAIRSQAQHPSQRPSTSSSSDSKLATPPNVPIATTKGLPEQTSERLTSLPKPKVSNKFGSTPAFTGTKPPLPNESVPRPVPSAVHGASRTFADQGGKTPAQIWAEKKARERGEDFSYESPGYRESNKDEDWKSASDTPSDFVKATHTGKSIGRSTSPDVAVSRDQSIETEPRASPKQHITTWQEDPKPVESVAEDSSRISDASRSIPVPEQHPEPVEQNAHDPEHHEFVPGPPEQASPPSSLPARETSPIRVAMPVSRGNTEPQLDQGANSSVSQTGEVPQAIMTENALEDDLHAVTQDRSQAATENHDKKTGIRAIAQYDYDKAEDNEIQLQEGEYVVDIDMVDRDWWLGSNVRGERGLFPSNYVEIVEHDQESHSASNPQDTAGAEKSVLPAESTMTMPTATTSTSSPSATALYDYEAAEDNELSFPEGAQITSIEFPDDDWWFGEFHGKKGLFPANYVEIAK